MPTQIYENGDIEIDENTYRDSSIFMYIAKERNNLYTVVNAFVVIGGDIINDPYHSLVGDKYSGDTESVVEQATKDFISWIETLKAVLEGGIAVLEILPDDLLS